MDLGGTPLPRLPLSAPLRSAGTAMSISTSGYCFVSLCTTALADCASAVSVNIFISQVILTSPFSATGKGWWWHHLLVHPNLLEPPASAQWLLLIHCWCYKFSISPAVSFYNVASLVRSWWNTQTGVCCRPLTLPTISSQCCRSAVTGWRPGLRCCSATGQSCRTRHPCWSFRSCWCRWRKIQSSTYSHKMRFWFKVSTTNK